MFKDALGFSAVLFDFYRVYRVQINTHFIAPDKSDHDYQDQLFYSFNILKMGFFEIEPTGFHGSETHFYLPSFFIFFLCFFGFVEGYDDEIFPFPIPIIELASR